MFCKRDILKNVVKFTGKHLCWRLFFNKVAELRSATYNAQNMKFSIKDFCLKCDQIRMIWSHLLRKSLMENFIFYAALNKKLQRSAFSRILRII